MAAPHEIVAAPLTVYLAPVGTAFPAIDDEEAAFVTWEKLGQQGSKNVGEDGVNVEHGETTEDFTPAGSTMPIKRFRTAESFLISLELVDISPETYAKVMNNATVTQTPQGVGVAGESEFSLFRGDQVEAFAVLARGPSSVAEGGYFHYEFSRAFVSVNGTVTWNKGTPARLPIEIMAVKYEDTDDILVRVFEEAAS